MEQSPSPHLWNPNVHYRIHKCPTPVRILSPLYSVPTTPPTSRSLLILSSHLHLGLPYGLFPSGFPIKTLCTPPPSPTRATCPAHLILLDFTTRTILGKEYRSLSSSLCNFLHSPYKSVIKYAKSVSKSIKNFRITRIQVILTTLMLGGKEFVQIATPNFTKIRQMV
jgi:hypothetical protein